VTLTGSPIVKVEISGTQPYPQRKSQLHSPEFKHTLRALTVLIDQASQVVEQAAEGAVLQISFLIPSVGTPAVRTSQRAA